MQNIASAGQCDVPRGAPNHFVEHLRVESLSIGTYCIPATGADDQRPHTEDEVYIVISGSGSFVGGSERMDVGAGTTLFVPAGEDHRFVDIVEDLVVLVVFSPPYETLG